MTDNLNQHDELGPDFKVSDWIPTAVDLLLDREQFATMSGVSLCSEDFLKKCREAGAMAGKVAALSSAVMDIGFLPLAFSKYVKRVEELTGIAAGPVLHYFGITDPEALNDRSVSGFGRLWSALGIPLRQALANLRIALLHPYNTLWEGIRLRGAGRGGTLELCESELRHLQARATVSQLMEQHRLELAFLHAYEGTR